MSTKNDTFDFQKKLDEIFTYSNEDEKIQFEEKVINYELAELIKELMKLNKIKTKKELADKMGVSPAYLSKVFRSDKYFNVNFLAKAQRVFDTTFVFSAKALTTVKAEVYPSEGTLDFPNYNLFIEEEIKAHLKDYSEELESNDEAKVLPLYPRMDKPEKLKYGN